MNIVSSMCHKSLFFVILSCFALTGCDRTVVPVSGTVTLNGAPLVDATVLFSPDEIGNDKIAIQSYGKTDASGKYSLKRVDNDEAGAMPGKHRVSINCAKSSNPADDAAVITDSVPAEFQKHEFAVPPEGTAKADFALGS